jgi:hypothetical protein
MNSWGKEENYMKRKVIKHSKEVSISKTKERI